MHSSGINPETQALLEEAADEIARLDAACSSGPGCAGHAVWLVALAELTDPTRATFHALTASHADSFHEAALAPPVARWNALLPAEERRVRGGALLSVVRFSDVAPTLATYPDRARLEGVWREGSGQRPVLLRALDSAAWSPSTDLGEASAALLLCAGGRMDRVRFLPFASVSTSARAEATAAWRVGDPEPWARAALAAAARRARGVRESLRVMMASAEHQESTLVAMGRGGITARRGLTVLRAALATTMPALAEELAISRPAAADALDRLASAGLVREVTGRARDRVYAYDAACVVADAALAS